MERAHNIEVSLWDPIFDKLNVKDSSSLIKKRSSHVHRFDEWVKQVSPKILTAYSCSVG